MKDITNDKKPEPVADRRPEFGAVPEATKAMREKNVALQHELSDVRALLSMARQKLGIDEGTSIVQAIEKLQKCRDDHVAAEIEWEELTEPEAQTTAPAIVFYPAGSLGAMQGETE